MTLEYVVNATSVGFAYWLLRMKAMTEYFSYTRKRKSDDTHDGEPVLNSKSPRPGIVLNLALENKCTGIFSAYNGSWTITVRRPCRLMD